MTDRKVKRTASGCGATQRPETEGIVTIDPDRCIGCKTCMLACPWGALQWQPETGKVVKCDLCVDLIEAGLKTACVTVCLTQCLYFGTPEQIPEIRKERYVRQRVYEN